MKLTALFVALLEAQFYRCAADEPFSIKKVNSALEALKSHPPDELNGVGDLYSGAVAELDLMPAQEGDPGCDCAKQQMDQEPLTPGQAGTSGLVQYNNGQPVDPMALVAEQGMRGKTWSFLMKSSRKAPLGQVIEKGACECTPDPPKGPETDIDGEVIWLNECTLTQKDLEFWKLVRTEYRSGGIMIPNTIAYSASCDDCKQHNLQCAANEVKLERGYCLCMWRVDGADKKLKLVPCGRCVQDCLGKYFNFDLGVYLQPVQQRGICLKKKAYFNV
jgi:hypothetical protein